MAMIFAKQPVFYADQQPSDYYPSTVEPHPVQPALEGAADADLCIVGGGYAGLSAALHGALAGLDVRLLEAATLGAGASGRNGGQVGSGQRVEPPDLAHMFGKAAAQNLWRIGEDAKQLVFDLIDEHGIACDLRRGILYPVHKQKLASELPDFVSKMSEDYGYASMRYLSQDELQIELNASGYYGGVLDSAAGHLNPLAYLRGLARAALRAGAHCHEGSRVNSWMRNQQGGLIVRTETGEVRCKYLLFACNGYLNDLVPQMAARCLPIHNFVAATKPLSDAQIAGLIPNRYAVADSRFVINYYRIDAANRLVFGGGESYSYTLPTDVRPIVRKALAQVFPQLADTPLEFAWPGTLAITRNRLPQLLQLPSGAVAIGGFSGHGISIGTLAGKLAVEKLTEGSADFDAMTEVASGPFPGGTRLRQPMLVAAMLGARLLDRFG
ncbi:MAG: FAD-binding oxidoreductase [Pseudomonadota bacterium]